jgi:hypothetical protein
MTSTHRYQNLTPESNPGCGETNEYGSSAACGLFVGGLVGASRIS